jgi:hypothetical protein
MDYSKLDADLSAELDQAPADPNEQAFLVYVQTDRPLGPQEAAVLSRAGATGDFVGRDLFNVTLSARGIDELSNQPWVRSLKLSRRLRPLDQT